MTSIRLDLENNVVFIKLSGVVSVEDGKKFLVELMASLPDMKPGFSIINDISELRIFDPAYMEVLEKGHDIINQYSPGKVIRVIGNAKDTLFKFAKFDVEVRAEKSEFVPDMETAMQILNLK
ncbi:MAG: hypothetical protein KKA84_04190 [Bacteroidetes bacterium]|nr:hypothetical protein [Bacteroidota bacterium]